MSIFPRIRQWLARLIAANKFTRVFFKRLALDDKMLLLILNDPLCAIRICGNRLLANRIMQLASLTSVDALSAASPTQVPSPSDSSRPQRDSITDISLGLNWGPKAFPLTRHALYFRTNMKHLVARWLRRLPSDACVVLLADAEVMEAAQSFQMRFRQVKALFPMEALKAQSVDKQSNEPCPLSRFKELNAILVPMPVAHKEIEFIPDNTMPDMGPVYGVFHDLWQLGFRQFAQFSFSGFRQLEIPFLLDKFKDKHKGQRCFVAGNGPSLNQINMGLLKDEITLGSNRCYHGFEQWGFAFNYWSCIDRLQVEEYGLEYQDNLPDDMVKFLPFEYLSLVQFNNCCPLNFDYEWRPPYKFSGTPDVLYLGFTVTHALLQIAVIMGCNPIYLIGVDHRYDLNKKTVQNRRFGEKQAKIWVAEDSTKPTHFTDKYTTGETPKLFVTPKPDKAEACFEVAREWTQQRGIEIFNATPNSGLEIFPKVDYKSIF